MAMEADLNRVITLKGGGMDRPCSRVKAGTYWIKSLNPVVADAPYLEDRATIDMPSFMGGAIPSTIALHADKRGYQKFTLSSAMSTPVGTLPGEWYITTHRDRQLEQKNFLSGNHLAYSTGSKGPDERFSFFGKFPEQVYIMSPDGLQLQVTADGDLHFSEDKDAGLGAWSFERCPEE